MRGNPYLSTRTRHRPHGRLGRWRERGGPGGLVLHLGEVVGVVGEVGEDHALLVVVLAQDLVVAQEEAVADAESARGGTEVYITILSYLLILEL